MFDIFTIIICFLCTGCGGAKEPIPEHKDIFATYPSFKVPVVNITVVSGNTAILPCSVDFLGKHKVVWTDQWSTLLTFDNKRIIDDDRINVERPYTKDWNLLIHKVRYSDRGKYTCQINTKPIKTKHVMLHVLVEPHILENASSKDVIAKEGETVELICNVTGVPPPTVHWYRRPLGQSRGSKERLERRGNPFIGPCTYNLQQRTAIPTQTPPPAVIGLWSVENDGVGMHGEILVIHNVSRYCDGIYECMAFNDVPPAVNREMKVEVKFAPEITLPTKRMGQQPGRETMLECIITAFPLIQTNWIYKGREIQNTHKYRIDLYHEGDHQITLSLRIADINYDDYGNYTCFAKNKMGYDEETMILYNYKKSLPTTTSTTTTLGSRWPTSGADIHIPGFKDGVQNPKFPNNAGNDKEQIGSDSPGSSGITCTGSLVVICENNQQSQKSGLNGSEATRALLSPFIAIFIIHIVIKCFIRQVS